MEKAVILARGLGRRMRKTDGASLRDDQQAVAATGVKALVPIDRPFLDYVLTALADAGYRQICLVVGPEHEVLREYYGRTLSYERLSVDFALQVEPKGTADAVAAAEGFAGGDPFLVINSATHYPVEALSALRRLGGPGLAVFERGSMLAHSNIPPERITRFAVVESDEAGKLRRIVEKPDPEDVERLSDSVGVSMNCWRFDARIFASCAAIEPSVRGELEIPDAVQHAIDEMGQEFSVLTFRSAVLDLTSQADVEGVAEKLAGSPVRL